MDIVELMVGRLEIEAWPEAWASVRTDSGRGMDKDVDDGWQ